MEMFLMALCLSILGLAVTAMAFGAATRPERTPPPAEAQPSIVRPEARFFAQTPAPGSDRRVTVEELLLAIENHVRLEQAAAESFVESPTPAILHSRTSSRFGNYVN